MNEFKTLLDMSNRVLITSHSSPDPDAVCSVLLLGLTIQSNFPDKQVKMVLEDKPARPIDFLPGYPEIVFDELYTQINNFKPELFVIVDANTIDRCTKDGKELIRKYIKQNSVKTATIDHHEEINRDAVDLYINNFSPAATQDVYELCFDQLGLDKPNDYQNVAMLGILADTGRFKYDNPKYKETFKIAVQLIDDGASIEYLESKIDRYSLESILVISELTKNVDISNSYTYSYISDDFKGTMAKEGISEEDVKAGCEIFTNEFIRSIGINDWGFIIYPREDKYSVSFRSSQGLIDVSEITAKLGGGGHKAAAGARIEAVNVQDAISKVKSVLSSFQ